MSSTDTMTKRLLITGSRTWDDEERLQAKMLEVWRTVLGQPQHLIVVHGHCPDGADALAHLTAFIQPGWSPETHPADWEQHGKAAGFIRNQEMVNLGADYCLGFVMPCEKPAHHKRAKHPSHGSLDALLRARAASIPYDILTGGGLEWPEGW